MTLLGAHFNPADPISEALEVGANIVQTFVGDPQDWKKPVNPYPDGAAALREAAEAAGIGIYVHAPYVLNLASANNRIRIPSRKLLQQTIDEAALIGALGIVVHGGHVTAQDDPAVGFANWRKAIDGLRLEVPIFIENTAGGNHAMARELSAIEQLWEAISGSENISQVGFCLDTCHAHAAGLDLATVAEDIRAITGRIDLVHCNDSRDLAGSGADRHANLGHGQLPAEDLVKLLKTADAPIILETPGGIAERTADLAWLQERL